MRDHSAEQQAKTATAKAKASGTNRGSSERMDPLDRERPARAEWARRIATAWQSTLDGILEAGRLLIEAKAALEHGEFIAMVERELPFKERTAERLMKVVRDQRLVNPAHAPLLPPNWYTLYELTKLSDDDFDHALTLGLIKPDMQRKDLAPHADGCLLRSGAEGDRRG